MNRRINIIIVVITLIAVVAIINALMTNQRNEKLKTQHRATQQLLVKLQEQQHEKVTRELTDLLQDAQFIMQADANCPPNKMINQIKELHSNQVGLTPSIQASYEQVLNQLEVKNCN